MSAPQYRMLEAGEVLKEADQVQCSDGEWKAVPLRLQDTAVKSLNTFRRPTSPAPAVGHTPAKLTIKPGTFCFYLKALDVDRYMAKTCGDEQSDSDFATELVSRYNQHDALRAENAALRQALAEYVSLEERRYIQEELETGSKRPLARRNKLHQKARALLAQPGAGR